MPLNTHSRIEHLKKEMQKCIDEQVRIIGLPEAVITHPGGREHGINDYVIEEILILEEIIKLEKEIKVQTEAEKLVYEEAHINAGARNIVGNEFINQCALGFREGLEAVTILNLSQDEIEKIRNRVQVETNYGFGFICGVMAKMEAVKGKGYKASWIKRGQVDGAMVNLERKWDRLDEAVRRDGKGETISQILGDMGVYDVKWLTVRCQLEPEEFSNWIKEVANL